MRIGIPKEVKNHEHRVAMMPEGVAALVADGHELVVETNAGRDSACVDEHYRHAGARIVEDAAEAWHSDLVVKVKEPQACEYPYLQPGLTLFTFLHLAAVPELARVLAERQVCAIAYETIQEGDRLPVLATMSQVAGRVAAQLAVHFLQQENGTAFAGRGILPGGIAAVPAAQALVLGAGNVGLHAADALAGLGAAVTVLEANRQRVEALQGTVDERITVQPCTMEQIRHHLPDSDILIAAALIPGQHAPLLLQRRDIALMPRGSVLIDVSIDQGGSSETSRPTSYDDPVYMEQGVIHCCLPNLPGTVPLSSTAALTRASLPYIMLLAEQGIERAISMNPALASGVNVRHGHITHAGVAAALGWR